MTRAKPLACALVCSLLASSVQPALAQVAVRVAVDVPPVPVAPVGVPAGAPAGASLQLQSPSLTQFTSLSLPATPLSPAMTPSVPGTVAAYAAKAAPRTRVANRAVVAAVTIASVALGLPGGEAPLEEGRRATVDSGALGSARRATAPEDSHGQDMDAPTRLASLFDGRGLAAAADLEIVPESRPSAATESANRLEPAEPGRSSPSTVPEPAAPAATKLAPFAGVALVGLLGAGALGGFGAAAYLVANALSLVFPLPTIYEALRKGDARDYPLGRALLGAAGALALGLVNATVLGKPAWGIAHIFSALALLAPALTRWALPHPAFRAFAARGLSVRAAALWTGGAALAIAAASAVVYAVAAAHIPVLLAAASPVLVGRLLLGVQVAKAALFVAMFLPEVRGFFGKKLESRFSPAFALLYFISTACFVLWGWQAARASPPGPIREQYEIHALRNLLESAAALLALVALRRHNRK